MSLTLIAVRVRQRHGIHRGRGATYDVVVHLQTGGGVTREPNAMERDVMNQVVMDAHVADRASGIAVDLNAPAAGRLVNVFVGKASLLTSSITKKSGTRSIRPCQICKEM